RTIIVGFIAGAVSVLIFHQFGFWIANELGLLKVQLYSVRPLPPWGVPAILSSAFWGGLWGIVGAYVVPRVPPSVDGPWGWMLFAGVFVTLVNWFVVLPMKGAPIGGGFRMPGVMIVPLVYAFWGFGMWVVAGLTRRALRWR
ncbi:MAG: hypothetical protein A3D94_08295, partial [Alphaproteobacteria bacterium RIFCSPHIGHO2_12_FULL_66_14]